MKWCGIKHQLTPLYHPSSNGQAERRVQEFKKFLKRRPRGRSVKHPISLFLLEYRTTPNMTTGKSPAELLIKRELRTRLSILKTHAGQEIREHQQRQFHHATEKNREILPGEVVSVWNPRQDSKGRWLSGTVVQRPGPANYLVNVEGQTRYVHINHLLSRDPRSVQQQLGTGEATTPEMEQVQPSRSQ